MKTLEQIKPIKLIELLPKDYKMYEDAARDFSHSCKFKGNPEKFYNQTLVLMNHYTANKAGDFWATFNDEGEIVGFLLARIVTENGEPGYWITHAWVRKDHRSSGEGKIWWKEVRATIKDKVKALFFVSSRGAEVYKRFLGQGTSTYGHILKQDI